MHNLQEAFYDDISHKGCRRSLEKSLSIEQIGQSGNGRCVIWKHGRKAFPKKYHMKVLGKIYKSVLCWEGGACSGERWRKCVIRIQGFPMIHNMWGSIKVWKLPPNDKLSRLWNSLNLKYFYFINNFYWGRNSKIILEKKSDLKKLEKWLGDLNLGEGKGRIKIWMRVKGLSNNILDEGFCTIKMRGKSCTTNVFMLTLDLNLVYLYHLNGCSTLRKVKMLFFYC